MTFWESVADDRAHAHLAAAIAGFALGVSTDDILAPSRGQADVAFARQMAMYLTHVAFGVTLTRVAMAFGRDRSTVAYACHAIEDRRENASFDGWVEDLEAMLREAPKPRTLANLAR